VETVRSEIEMVTTTRTRKVAAENKKEYKTVQSIGMQFDMFGSMWTGAMLATDLMRQVGELSDVTAEQVRQSRQEYKKAADALAPFKLILDVYTSRWFGNEDTKQSQPAMLFLRDGANMKWLKDPRTAQADLKPDAAKIAATTLKTSREYRFFHWELEFPEVFFGASKNSAQEIVFKENAGFDAVIGNPPYSAKQSIETKILTNLFSHVEYKCDPFGFFLELGAEISSPKGNIGLIIPAAWMTNVYYEKIRRLYIENKWLKRVILFQGLVFESANVDTSIFLASKNQVDNSYETATSPVGGITLNILTRDYSETEKLSRFEILPPSFGWDAIRSKLISKSERLGDISKISLGMKLRANDEFVVKFKDADNPNAIYFGDDIDRYQPLTPSRFFNYDSAVIIGGTKNPEVYSAKPKLLVQAIRNLALERRIVSTIDFEGSYFVGTVNGIVLRETQCSIQFIQACIGSKLVNEFFARYFVTISLTSAFLGEIPIRKISFNTQKTQRNLLTQKGVSLLSGKESVAFLDFVDERLHEQPEESDVVHDLLAHLAERMIELNQQKQDEMKRLLGWLEGVLKVSVDELTGKSKVRNYIGDYQKDEPELTFAELDDILFKNKNKLGVSLNDSRLMAKVRDEYEKSLAVLRPIKSALKWTDDLIDQVVYRLYGLTEEEIAIVEGRG
jgi:hypothetical protein